MLSQFTDETISLMKDAMQSPKDGESLLAKTGFTQPSTAVTGLQGYMLEGPAKHLYPVITPLRNVIPRVNDGFSTQANWKAILSPDSTLEFPGVSEGNRARSLTPTVADYNAVFKGFGYEHKATFEAQYAGRTYEDIQAVMRLEALQAAMVGEEFAILGGNGSVVGTALGQANTPVGTLKTTTGSMSAQATACYVIGLTLAGLRSSLGTGATAWAYTSSTATYLPTASGAVVKVAFTRTNEDASTDTIKPGHGQMSAEASPLITTTSTSLGVDWVVAPKKGEIAWAWYTGATSAAACSLTAITTVPIFKQRLDAVATQKANATDLNVDESQDTLMYDGILTQIFNGGYYKTGLSLTATGAGGVTELDDFFQYEFDVNRLTNFRIYCNSRDRIGISRLIMGNGTANSAVRLTVPEGPGQIDLTANTVVSGYHNPVDGSVMPITVHPYLPAGTILIKSEGPLPYPQADVPNVWQIRNRQEYYSIDWPRTSRKYQIGVYWDGVLQGYFPSGNGIIQLAA